jgi:hypothetical protein
MQVDETGDQRVTGEINALRAGVARPGLSRGKDFMDAAIRDDDRVVGQGPRWIYRDDPARFDDEGIGQRSLRLLETKSPAEAGLFDVA